MVCCEWVWVGRVICGIAVLKLGSEGKRSRLSFLESGGLDESGDTDGIKIGPSEVGKLVL